MQARSVVAALVMCASIPSLLHAAPLLTNISSTSWTFTSGVTDGTSNTLVFGPSTRMTLCLPRAITTGFTDGTSNTIQFGESTGLGFSWSSRTPANSVHDADSNTIVLPELATLDCFSGGVVPEPLLGDITDGTTNTIIFGENPFRLGTERFDVCFDRVAVSHSTDGTSNTITLSERSCFLGVRVSEDLQVTAAPAPPLTAMLGLGFSVWAHRRRRSRPART